MDKHHIRNEKYTPYHPQENEKVEVTNRDLKNMLTNAINNN